MPLWGDDRGQSVVIGAVILFGFLVIAMSTYQATVVPQQNTQVEFTHEQTVRNDFVGVRDAVVTTGTTGETAPAAVKLGTRFPGRTLFVNPPPAVGRIETGEPRNVTLNVSQATFRANPPEPDEVEDGWPTSASEQVGADEGVANYTTKPLVYTPQYRSYDGGPDNVTLELSHALSRYAGGETVNLTEAPLLARGDRVTLFLVKGNLSESGVEPVTLEPTAVSSVSQRVRVSNFTVTVPTSLTAAQFERLANETRVSNPENVSFSDNGSRVDVTFEDNRSLGVGVVSLGRYEASRTAAAVEFTSVEANVTAGESARVVVRVRDQYGNALPNADVTANMSDDGRDGKRLVTGGTGQAAFEFDTGSVNGSVNVSVNVTVNESGFDVTNRLTSDDFDQSTAENATANVTVEEPDDGGGGDGRENGTSGSWPLEWTDPFDSDGLSQDASLTPSPPSECSNTSCTVDAGGTGAKLNLRVTTNSATDGTSVSYAVSNTSVGVLNTSSGTTNAAGNDTVELDPRDNGTMLVSATSGGTTTTIEVEFSNISTSQNNNIKEVSGSADTTGNSGKATFDLTNTGDSPVEIVGIAWNNTSSSAEVISGNNKVFEGKDDNSKYDNNIQLNDGNYSLNVSSTLSSGSTKTYEFDRFEDSGGNKVNLTGESVTITLYLKDGGKTDPITLNF